MNAVNKLKKALSEFSTTDLRGILRDTDMKKLKGIAT